MIASAKISAAVELFVAADAANKKLRRNLNTCTFISLTRREEDPFVVYADKLARFEKEANETHAAWMAGAGDLNEAELIEVITQGSRAA